MSVLLTSEAICLAVHHHVLTLGDLAGSVVEIGVYCEFVGLISGVEAWWGDGPRVELE